MADFQLHERYRLKFYDPESEGEREIEGTYEARRALRWDGSSPEEGQIAHEFVDDEGLEWSIRDQDIIESEPL